MKIIKIQEYFLLKDKQIKPTILTLSELIRTRGKEIGVDFSRMKETRKGDLLVLYAQAEKSIITYRNKLYRKGSLPSDKRIKKLLLSSYMMFHVNEPTKRKLSEITDAEKQKLLNPNLIDSIVKDLKKIGIKEYYYPFNVFLTELIGNAVEHGIENKNINWWLTQEFDKKNKIAQYTFVDMGLGIVDSHKKAGLPFKYFFLRNNRIVLDAFFGKLRSSTRQSNRGKGLPQLREMIERQYITNLHLITNSVSLHFKGGAFETRKNPNFIGTYYSWTVDQNNYKKWKNIK